MNNQSIFTGMLLTTLLAVAWPAPAAAVYVPTETSAESVRPAGDPSKADLEMVRFAQAFVQIRRIRKVYDASLRSSHDPAAQAALQAEEDAAWASAAQRAGIGMHRYNELVQQINHQPVMARALKNLLEQLGTFSKSKAHALARNATRNSLSDDILVLPKIEIIKPHVTRALVNAEVALALHRSVTSDRQQRNLLICRNTSPTGTHLKRMWCGLNGQLYLLQKETQRNVRRLQFGGSGGFIPSLDTRSMADRWQAWYHSLPEE